MKETVTSTRILVASENATDAALVKKILSADFENVSISTDPDAAVVDCDRDPPALLVLAFDGVDKAQRYYLGVCRHSKKLLLQPHRTLLLCSTVEVRLAYEMCLKRLFDDYVQFWPMTHDPMRLAMAAHIAVREVVALRNAGPSATQYANEARQLSGLEGAIDRGIALGSAQVAGAGKAARQVRTEVDSILEGFAVDLAKGLSRERETSGQALSDEVARIRAEIRPRLKSLVDSIEPLAHWATEVREDIRPQLAAAQNLAGLSERSVPTILVVDDDSFQHRLVARMLASANYRLVFASSGAEALASVSKVPPDLILMDMMMPNMDGAETTRQIRAMPMFAKTSIIMMTGNSNSEVVTRSIRAGANDFVVKPMDGPTLSEKVAKGLGVETPLEYPLHERA